MHSNDFKRGWSSECPSGSAMSAFEDAKPKTKSLERGLRGSFKEFQEEEEVVTPKPTSGKPKRRHRSLKFSLGSAPLATVPPVIQGLQSTFTTKDGESYGLSKEVTQYTSPNIYVTFLKASLSNSEDHNLMKSTSR